MRYGSLFSGIGGIDLGLDRAGMSCAWQVEVDEFCLKVLNKHWPDVPKYKDVRDVGAANLEPVDLICGGFPCQDVSLSGQREGLEGERSTLWTEFARVVREIKPRWILVENVFGLLSSDDGAFFGDIFRELAAGGYDAEWDVLPAENFGAPHPRERLFIVAYAKSLGFREGKIFSRSDPKDFAKAAFRGQVRPAIGGSVCGRNWLFPSGGAFRVDDGIPYRLDRLKSCGNAVVPQAAEWIARRILEAER